MHGLLEFLRIVVRDDVVLVVEQIAVAVALEDGAEIPAVAVIIGKLRVLELRIELGHAAQEVDVGPFAARRRALGVAVEHFARRLIDGYCCFSGHIAGASDS